MNRRHILGLGAGGLIAAGSSRAVPASINAAMAETLAHGGLLGREIGEACADPRPIEDMMSAAERLLHGEREREADERRAEADARHWNRQFLHSMSLSARRAFNRRDEMAARAARSALWEFLDVIHGRNPTSPPRAVTASNARRLR